MSIGLLAGCNQPNVTLVDHRVIWDRAPHNAFTDLCWWRGEWWCCFREADRHDGNCIGSIRVLRSRDGANWVDKIRLRYSGIDLRDPKLSVTPDDRLMLTVGPQSRVAFLANPREGFGPLRRTIPTGWLWRVTWINGVGYGFSYAKDGDPLTLWKTTDGLLYDKVADVAIPGRPTEATICQYGEVQNAVVRREGGDRAAWIGSRVLPDTGWKWDSLGVHIGGPNAIRLPDGRLIISGRINERMVLAESRGEGLYHLLTLPSGGDCGYAGMVWHDGVLWMTYYSSHEGKAKIYLAKVKL